MDAFPVNEKKTDSQKLKFTTEHLKNLFKIQGIYAAFGIYFSELI
jgi:hypothetical protein